MLPSNGRTPRQHYNYHMTFTELKQLYRMVCQNYDPLWNLMITVQFSLGLRCSEVAAINIFDISEKDNQYYLKYRQAKSNKIIEEPLPMPVYVQIKQFFQLNSFRCKDGYLFSKYARKGKYINTETIGTYWCKWRAKMAKQTNNMKWLEISPEGKHRISSHSLRRLHRTIMGNELGKKGFTDYIIAKLCNYEDVNTFTIYRNEFELQEKKGEIMHPVINPIIDELKGIQKGQKTLGDFWKENKKEGIV